MSSTTVVRITEDAGRIYVHIGGLERDRLRRALTEEFRGHRRIYRSRRLDDYRLWHKDRAALERWLERWCEQAWIAWAGR